MTTPAPQRRERRKTHLDASVVPVERAFLARAAVLDERAESAPGHPELGIGPEDARLLRNVAAEFRAVAEEFTGMANRSEILTDGDLLERTHRLGLTVLSSARTRRSYLVLLELAEDGPALRGYVEYEDGKEARGEH